MTQSAAMMSKTHCIFSHQSYVDVDTTGAQNILFYFKLHLFV